MKIPAIDEHAERRERTREDDAVAAHFEADLLVRSAHGARLRRARRHSCRLRGHRRADNPDMAETARRVFVSTLIVVGVVVAVLALWKLRLVIALLFLAFIIAAAMRPGVEALQRRAAFRAAPESPSTTSRSPG